MRWQPSLGGTLSLGRTNSFFLGGGRAMLNALYLTAEKLGVEIVYDAEVTDLVIEDGMFLAARLKRPIKGETEIRATSLVAAAGGFEANIEWLKQYWGEAADNFLIRGTPYNRGSILKMLLDKGVQEVGDPTQCHAVAIDARAPKFDGGIITRHDSVVFGIVVNKHAQRFYDEGEDIWPKRYAIWGRLVAAQPDQIAYIIFDSTVVTSFMPTLFPPIEGADDRRARRQARARSGRAGKDHHRIQRRGAARHLRPHHPRRLPDRRHHAAEDALGAQNRDAALSRLSGAARHHLHLSRHPREQGGADADEGRQAVRQHVRGRRDHGRQRARQGLCGRHRHDHRQRVRADGGTGSGAKCEELDEAKNSRRQTCHALPLLPIAAAADRRRNANAAEPIALRDMGSFHVGGRLVEISGKPVKEVVFTPGGVPAKVDPNGTYQVEQMYVQYFLPANEKGAYPLLMWHGGGLTGVTYETTPDGREGWLNYFLRKGWSVYNSDAVERGRAGWAQYPDIFKGEPVFLTTANPFERFRIGDGPDSYDPDPAKRKLMPGSQFPSRATRISSSRTCRAGPRPMTRSSPPTSPRSTASAPA